VTIQSLLTISDPNAPPRLQGLAVIARIDREKGVVEFEPVNLPADLTRQERGYLDWSNGEAADAVRRYWGGN
jgi:hypothetical protein